MDTIQPNNEPVTVTKASGFVVVSWWQDKSGNGRKGSFEYGHHKTLKDALDEYEEYQSGEFPRASAMGVFACDALGLPLHRLQPTELIPLMREQRSGR